MKSVYIHIPFCNSICSYCDFSKYFYNENWVDKYLDALKKEVISKYKGEVLDTIYIGGGTPSCLSILELQRLFDIVNLFKFNENFEFTFECNIENLTKEKLKFLFSNKVNRLSIGVQTFNESYLELLNRHQKEEEVFKKIDLAKSIGFKNINIDLIYAIPGETLDELNKDIDLFLKLKINHISTYSLMIEPNTNLFNKKIQNIDQDTDYNMYKIICNKLKKAGYNHYEISNFAIKGYESKHNLTYWNNEKYYGFGIGASGYIKNVRYDNTRSFSNYLKGKYVLNREELSKLETIQNEFILGLRKIKGINKNQFKKKYNIDIKSIEIVKKLLKEKKLIEDEENIFISKEKLYISNEILIEFI